MSGRASYKAQRLPDWPKRPLDLLLGSRWPAGAPAFIRRRLRLTRNLVGIFCALKFLALVGVALIVGRVLTALASERALKFAFIALGVVLLLPANWGLLWLTRWRMRKFARRVSEEEYMCCVRCGYSLRGLPTEHKCPECGQEYDALSLRSEWGTWARQ